MRLENDGIDYDGAGRSSQPVIEPRSRGSLDPLQSWLLSRQPNGGDTSSLALSALLCRCSSPCRDMSKAFLVLAP